MKKLMKTNAKSMLNSINRIKAKKMENVYKVIFLIMVEMKNGGIALLNVEKENIVQSNWKLMRRRYRKIISQIHEWHRRSHIEFENLLNELSTLIADEDFHKWKDIEWFRFLVIKSLHDASMLSIDFDYMSDQLSIVINKAHAIDEIPFDKIIKLTFQVDDFNIENFDKLVEYTSKYETVIWGVTTYFKEGNLRINIDYDCYQDTSDDLLELPEIDFFCSNLIIDNVDIE